MPLEAPRRHRLTVGDYYQMAEVGILRPDERVELIDGGVFDVPPPGSRHAGCVEQLAALLRRAAGGSGQVRVQNPVRLGDLSEPQPDLALVRPRADYYKLAHPIPEDVLLIIEIAQSSLRYDRDVKVPLYATHRIPEVWLIDLDSGRTTRYREPAENGYRLVDAPPADAALEICALAGETSGTGVAHEARATSGTSEADKAGAGRIMIELGPVLAE